MNWEIIDASMSTHRLQITAQFHFAYGSAPTMERFFTHTALSSFRYLNYMKSLFPATFDLIILLKITVEHCTLNLNQ